VRCFERETAGQAVQDIVEGDRVVGADMFFGERLEYGMLDELDLRALVTGCDGTLRRMVEWSGVDVEEGEVLELIQDRKDGVLRRV
jgi:hypothetical protein